MVQTYSAQGEAYFDAAGGQPLDLAYYLQIVQRRWLLFAALFSAVLLIGAFVTAIQHPIYEFEGKVLVELQDIPSDLVMPTVTDSANQRIQVIQQRIMTRDNLLGLVKKYNMFAKEREWMSGTEVLDLMRQRTRFDLVDISATPGRSASTIAFTVSFEYENPDITQNVANDLLTLILAEDAHNRTSRATETTNFLEHESLRLQGELAAIEAQIAQSQVPPKDDANITDPAQMQVVELAKLKDALAQEAATHSEAFPAVVALRKRIAAMEALIAKTPSPAAAQANAGLVDLERRRLATEENLTDTNKKLEEARLGEKLERDQEFERLQVIEQPILPQTPIKPNRGKLLAVSFALAMAVGAGAVFAAEMLDGSIRHSRQLLGAANGRMIVSIPYIATTAERSRKRGRLVVLLALGAVLLLGGVSGFLFFGPPIDLSWVKQFWLDHLTRLSK